jgi:DegV family protein with EDD domain
LKIRYLSSKRLYLAVLAGGDAVIQDQAYLNKINVFPVPDADTGTNLATTMRAIAEGARSHPSSIKATFKSIANAALGGARGNSGLIFAQFIHGLSKEIGPEPRLTTMSFGESVSRAVQHAYRAIAAPVEGTMITVIREWAEAVYRNRMKTADFVELWAEGLAAARQSLRETTQKLQVLARAGVVDAGAKGFVDFLEGVLHFMSKGRMKRHAETVEAGWTLEEIKTPAKDKSLEFRYCAEALLTGTALDADGIRDIVRGYGTSAVVAGSEERVRLHVHTNAPQELFQALKDRGTIAQIKVDDMRRQYEAAHAPKAKIGIVADSACDLPPEVLDDLQIHVLPFPFSFGEQQFLDKVTIRPHQFYEILKTSRVQATTSQPGQRTVLHFLSYLADHYESLIFLTVSGKLSGFHDACRSTVAALAGKRITLIDSRNVSAGIGLSVARAAAMAVAGASHDEIVAGIESWIPRTKIYVDVDTIKYLVRGGRVSAAQGMIGGILHIKPIIVLDKEGRAESGGKSFSRAANMAKILRKIQAAAASNPVHGYAVVHVHNRPRADAYARKLTVLLGRAPDFIIDAAPVIGVHAGIGATAVVLQSE